ncbi:hypothetical protein GCM10007390_34460 [Persicitalea jodogahamensis]|uniref:Uncharacterized protein n=1 Tax=Persicitalea jodogahamensis TaxID=402147 RepID=A0A8J3DAT6_9BACT|nr:hypothetical protein GCM10007390_34460 [Persicitalea jodogahamensis]
MEVGPEVGPGNLGDDGLGFALTKDSDCTRRLILPDCKHRFRWGKNDWRFRTGKIKEIAGCGQEEGKEDK